MNDFRLDVNMDEIFRSLLGKRIPHPSIPCLLFILVLHLIFLFIGLDANLSIQKSQNSQSKQHPARRSYGNGQMKSSTKHAEFNYQNYMYHFIVHHMYTLDLAKVLASF
jgi:NADH:ubiquinone oxidoreductase subunit 3 (subunit A)